MEKSRQLSGFAPGAVGHRGVCTRQRWRADSKPCTFHHALRRRLLFVAQVRPEVCSYPLTLEEHGKSHVVPSVWRLPSESHRQEILRLLQKRSSPLQRRTSLLSPCFWCPNQKIGIHDKLKNAVILRVHSTPFYLFMSGPYTRSGRVGW